MFKKSSLIVLLLVLIESVQAQTTLLYQGDFAEQSSFPELLLNNVACQFTKDGLIITGNNNLIKLNKFYSLGERLVRYHLRFARDSKAVFQSSSGDLKLIIDVPGQIMQLQSKPARWKRVSINPLHEYLLEVERNYQQTLARLSDLSTGEDVILEINGDGSGGVGKGAVGEDRYIVHHWDYYCFGLEAGTSLTIKKMMVKAMEANLTLLIYGDSQSQPEGYFPANDFQYSWTQLIMKKVKGKSMSSGRGGGTIIDLFERIKNELPFLKARYVMVTIGTNGGNTEEKLSELVEYIQSKGSIPILNNIPCNESSSQIENNRMIEKVRKKYKIKGVLFDEATSLNRNGKEVDITTMWLEDYSEINGWGHIYHHPNVKGSKLMFLQTLIDVPEIYE